MEPHNTFYLKYTYGILYIDKVVNNNRILNNNMDDNTWNIISKKLNKYILKDDNISYINYITFKYNPNDLFKNKDIEFTVNGNYFHTDNKKPDYTFALNFKS